MPEIKIFPIKHLKEKKINKKDVKFYLSSLVKESLKHYSVFNTFRSENAPRRDQFKKFLKFKKVVIIGMGGSVLASKSIYNFMKNKIKKKFYFIDNLDREILKNFLNEKKNTLFLLISKSGTTLETLSSVSIIEKIIKNYNTVVITENSNNPLNKFAIEKKLRIIEHKKYIGGRFSVFSDVGMFPAYLMGLNVSKILNAAQKSFKNFEKILIQDVPILNNIYSNKNFNSIVLLNYSNELYPFLEWCQQLIAESLGKKGKGLLPVISKAPKDHHSLLQLYLGGPKDKLFYIFSDETNQDLIIKKNIFKNSYDLKNKHLNQIVLIQKKALVQTLDEKKIPYKEFSFTTRNETALGKLFAYFILETVLIGKTLKINPFNQPEVETVKIKTKKRL
tara:strand:- start:480 stop:1652 length:1173 start_codon:yes stop_codon:yes gene_type:complete